MAHQYILDNNIDDLTKLGLQYHTDKAFWHRYTEFYKYI